MAISEAYTLVVPAIAPNKVQVRVVESHTNSGVREASLRDERPRSRRTGTRAAREITAGECNSCSFAVTSMPTDLWGT